MSAWETSDADPAEQSESARLLWACISTFLCTALVAGIGCFAWGCNYQSHKDTCQVLQATNFLGSNSAVIATYCG